MQYVASIVSQEPTSCVNVAKGLLVVLAVLTVGIKQQVLCYSVGSKQLFRDSYVATTQNRWFLLTWGVICVRCQSEELTHKTLLSLQLTQITVRRPDFWSALMSCDETDTKYH
jgi:sulfur relay (sulfurtransferase) DsrF/TusC family protein